MPDSLPFALAPLRINSQEAGFDNVSFKRLPKNLPVADTVLLL